MAVIVPCHIGLFSHPVSFTTNHHIPSSFHVDLNLLLCLHLLFCIQSSLDQRSILHMINYLSFEFFMSPHFYSFELHVDKKECSVGGVCFEIESKLELVESQNCVINTLLTF